VHRVRAARLAACVALTIAVSGVSSAIPAAADPVTSVPDQNCVPQSGGTIVGQPWAQKLLGFDRVWPITTGEGIRVAVIDTGIDRRQPQMAQIHVQDGRDVSGTGTGPTDTTDCNGHGTGVAGIIAAPHVNDTLFEGVAPGVTIIPVRQTGSDGKGTTQALAAGITYAVDQHANVINVSISAGKSTASLQAAVAYAARHNVVIVAAAGNDGDSTEVSKISYPAAYASTYPNVIGVAAIDEKGQIASFSDTGNYVCVAAPGSNIVIPSRQSGYTTDSGTSFATPFVTGTVALMMRAFPALTPLQLRNRLEATADPPPVTVPSNRYGYGIVDPYLALTSVRDDSAPPPSAAAVAPLPAPVRPQPPDRHLQHVALGAGLGLVGLAVLAGLAVVAFRRPGARRPDAVRT